MERLSNRQKELESLVQEFISKKGLKLDSREILGDPEKELYVLIKVSGLEIYIYDDGEAGIFRSKVDRRYELLDYRDFEELKKRFIADLSDIIDS